MHYVNSNIDNYRLTIESINTTSYFSDMNNKPIIIVFGQQMQEPLETLKNRISLTTVQAGSVIPSCNNNEVKANGQIFQNMYISALR